MDHVEITLIGHLDLAQLDRALDAADERLRESSGSIALLVDCEAMEDYDMDARERFVEWNRANRASISRVAIVTDRVLWQVVIGAMALASRQSMRAFPSKVDALAWLASEPTKGKRR